MLKALKGHKPCWAPPILAAVLQRHLSAGIPCVHHATDILMHPRFPFACLLAVLATFSHVTFASGEHPAAAHKGGDPADCLLWRIAGNGLEDTSWLFGTIHLINQEDFVVREEVEQAMAASKTVAFELKLNDLSMAMKMMRLIQLPGDSTLEDVLEADQYEALRGFVKDSSGLDFSAFERQKPLALMQLLLQDMVPGTPASYEMHFLQVALGAGQPIVGLEEIEDQMAVFDGIPYAEQAEWILDLYRNADSMQASYDSLVQAYTAEDLTRLQKLMLEESPEMMAHSEALLYNRNRNWIPKIESLINAGSTFVAVGAAHLPGEEGVVALLQHAGYSVSPVPAKTTPE